MGDGLCVVSKRINPSIEGAESDEQKLRSPQSEKSALPMGESPRNSNGRSANHHAFMGNDIKLAHPSLVAFTHHKSGAYPSRHQGWVKALKPRQLDGHRYYKNQLERAVFLLCITLINLCTYAILAMYG